MFCFSHHKTLKMDSYERTRHNSMFIEDFKSSNFFFIEIANYKDNQIFVTIVMQFSLFQFKEGDLRPVNDDILIAKLRPGQVCQITYKLVPVITEN